MIGQIQKNIGKEIMLGKSDTCGARKNLSCEQLGWNKNKLKKYILQPWHMVIYLTRLATL